MPRHPRTQGLALLGPKRLRHITSGADWSSFPDTSSSHSPNTMPETFSAAALRTTVRPCALQPPWRRDAWYTRYCPRGLLYTCTLCGDLVTIVPGAHARPQPPLEAVSCRPMFSWVCLGRRLPQMTPCVRRRRTSPLGHAVGGSAHGVCIPCRGSVVRPGMELALLQGGLVLLRQAVSGRLCWWTTAAARR